jgi:hypothetical protein
MFFGRFIPEGDHLLELPGGVYMHQRERYWSWSKGLAGKMKQNRGVLADGIQHHWLSKGSSCFPENLDGFVF